jgi:hypothetical protein
MGEAEFQMEVLTRLSAIEQQLRSGEGRMDGHEARVRDVEKALWEAKGKYAIVASLIAAAFSLACLWLGKHM